MVRVIFIPRFTVFTEEYEVYSNLMEFLALSERLYRGRQTRGGEGPAISVLRDMGNTTKLPLAFIQDLFFVLRDTTFSYRPLPPSKERNSKLLSEEFVSQWSKQKTELKRLIKRHLDPVMALKECQSNWWQSRDKVTQYATMLEAAQVSLQYNMEDRREFRTRQAAIKGLKKDLASKHRKHSKNVQAYMEALETEHAIRREIIEISESLQNSITERIKDKLTEALDQLQAVSGHVSQDAIDVDEISATLYKLTSRKYKFDEPDEVQTVSIARPSLIESPYQPYENNVTYASYNYTGTVADQCLSFTKDHLNLKPGDEVKLKILSRGGRLGFGWSRPSRLSTKRWGFFPTTKVAFVENKSP